MKIQKLSGGIANQMFQYAFMRFGEIASEGKEDWYLDDSEYFIRNVYNGYELEKVFGVKPKLLSQAFDEDVWDEIINLRNMGYSIPQILKDFDSDIVVYSESEECAKETEFDGEIYRMQPEGGFYPEIATLDFPNVYYDGNWVDKSWFNTNREVMLKELAFPVEKPGQVQIYADKIKGCRSVAMHVRRGDFVDKGLSLDPEYYRDAIKELNDTYDDYTLFVFSDDLYWCNQHAGELGINFAKKAEYISGNFKAGSFHDLELMSMCKVHIMANSSFSYIAGIMNTNLELYKNPLDRKWNR